MKNVPFAVERIGLHVAAPARTVVQTRLRVLGTFSLELSGVTVPSLRTQKARALLAYVIEQHGSDVARERLLEMLWPDAAPEAARDGLRSALWSTRRSIKDAGFNPSDYLAANRTVVRWKAPVWLDSDAFEELAKSDDALDLDACVDLYKGDFLEGDYEQWTVAERSRLSQMYDSVLERLVRIHGRLDAAQLLLNRNPYDEAAYALLIDQDLQAGRIVAASALAAQCERALSELGAEPSEELKRKFAGISVKRIQSAARLVMPFAGRASELLRARTHLTSARRPDVLVICGEAGIGKSALLARVAEIACSLGLEVEQVSSFDSDSRTFGPFEDLYERLYGETFDSRLSNDHRAAVQSLAESIFNRLDSATVLILDDAHFLSGDALAVMSALTKRVSAAGRALLLASRTEGLEHVESALRGCDRETIFLGALPYADLRTAIDSVVADDQGSLAAMVYERSGGHPFFAASLLDSLAQSGVLRSEAPMWRLAAPLNDKIPLPKTLSNYIQSRICAPGENASAVAAALSIEPSASCDDLVSVLNMPEEEVLLAVDGLAALGVLATQAWSVEFAFAHDLYREVAAGLLNPGRRMRLHRAFAQRLSTRSGSETSIRRARHLAAAGEMLAAAEAYSVAASDALLARTAIEAVRRCTEGLTTLENAERTAEAERCFARLKVLSAKATAASGETGMALVCVNDAITAAKRLNDADLMTEAALVRDSVFRDQHNAAAVLVSSDELITASRHSNDRATASFAMSNRSWAERVLGHEMSASQAANDAVLTASEAANDELACYALEQAILTAVTWWQFPAAVASADRGLLAMTRGSTLARAALNCSCASLALAVNRPKEAHSALTAAHALLQRDESDSASILKHSPFRTAVVRLALESARARLALASGDAAAALEAAGRLDTINSPRSRSLAVIFKVETYLLTGQNAIDERIVRNLNGIPFAQDVDSGSRSLQLAQALLAAMTGASDARELALQSLDAVEEAAHRVPLEADLAFTHVARAAAICGAEHVARRAALRSRDYSAARALAIVTIPGGDIFTKNA